MAKNVKKLTILHSNDMHGDFFAEEVDSHLIGGVSMLSGYLTKVRKEEKNVIYCVAGDMFRGNIIDSEYKGISTIQMMNLLAPDVVTLGNHEVDYGLAHLLFIEKCARFPIINANMYLNTNHTRLFKSHLILEIDGMKVLFIGVLTEQVLDQTKQDKLIGAIVDLKEAASEIGKTCNAYRTEDIDFTVLLTHIGIEEDKKLAEILNPDWGVDIIIGGHSHTYMEEPVVVAGIPIVQASCGTDYIGRFDIMVDTDRNCIDSYQWKIVPIEASQCPRDKALDEVLQSYKNVTDSKYNRIITRFADEYTHPVRNRETSLGKLLADVFKEVLGVDIMILGSGSIRLAKMGPIVCFQDMVEAIPFEDPIYRIILTGAQLRRMVKFLLRDEAFLGDTEFYQFSRGFRVEYDKKTHTVISLSFNGSEINDNDSFRCGIQQYHLMNCEKFFTLTEKEINALRKPKVVSTSATDVLEEYFTSHELIRASDERRIIIHNLD